MELFLKTLAYIFPIKATWLVFVSCHCSLAEAQTLCPAFPWALRVPAPAVPLPTGHRGLTRTPLSAACPHPVRPGRAWNRPSLARWGQRKSRAQRRNKERAVDVMLVANPSSPKAFFPSAKARRPALPCSWKWAEPVVRPEQAELGSWKSLNSPPSPGPCTSFTPGLQFEGMVSTL